MGLASIFIGKTAVKGLGLAVDAAGSIVSAASGLAKGLAKGVSDAANAEDKPNATKSVIGNVGIAGTAGTQKVTTGGGTLPTPKKAAKPAFNEKMPTEKLLAVAVGYLASIDNTLRTQIENDRVAYQKQVQAEKEAAVENKTKTTMFENMGWMDKKPSSSMANKILAGGALIAGLGALGISQLDTTELDALKQNVEAFKKDYGWLVDMASFIGVGGFIGFLKGGVKGGLVGIVAEYVFDKLWHSSLNPLQPKDENGNPIKAESGAGKGAFIAGIGALGVRSSIKKLGAGAGMKALDVLKKPNYATMTGAGKGAARKAGLQGAEKATAWFATRGGRRFLIILERRLGKKVMQKIAGILAKVVGGFLLAGTGIGAIPGIAMAIFNAGLFVWGIYDIAVAIWDAYQEWKNTKDVDAPGKAAAVTVSGNTATSNATKAAVPSTGIKAKSETGRPEEAQAFFESKGWTKEQASGIVGNLFVESGLRTDAEGDGGDAYGIAQWHPDRQAQFERQYGKSIRESNFQEQLEFVNWELNNSEKAAGNALRGATTAADAAAIVDSKYERSSGAAIAQRQANATSIAGGNYANLQGGGGSGGEAAPGSLEGMLAMGKKIFGKAGAAIVGAQNYTYKPLNEKIDGPSQKIQDLSKKIETATIAGDAQKTSESGPSLAASAGQKSISQASNDGTLGALDPNYPGGKDLIMTYLAHWKFAA
jgi:hypothetical protein